MIHVACLLWRRDDLHRFPALDFLTKTLCHSGDTATFMDTLTENRTYGVARQIHGVGGRVCQVNHGSGMENRSIYSNYKPS
jgi:hypothetical protein